MLFFLVSPRYFIIHFRSRSKLWAAAASVGAARAPRAARIRKPTADSADKWSSSAGRQSKENLNPNCGAEWDHAQDPEEPASESH